MKIIIQNPKSHSRNLLRQAGYSMSQNRKGEINFSRRLGPSEYPKFHIYVNKEEVGEIIEMEMHIDEKKPSYEGSKAHSGQYDGDLVEKEKQRILKSMSC